MIGLDTNVLVRFITDDDPVWSKPATRFVETVCTPARPGYINLLVLAEVAWALRSREDFSKKRLAALIKEMLEADNLKLERKDVVQRALVLFEDDKAGFADCLILAINEDAGAMPTYSIDKAAVRGAVFAALPKSGKP